LKNFGKLNAINEELFDKFVCEKKDELMEADRPEVLKT
jgi:hypothetical protein